MDPTFFGIFVCGPLQFFFVVNVCTLISKKPPLLVAQDTQHKLGVALVPERKKLAIPFFTDAVSFFCLRNPTRLARDLKLQPIKVTQFFGTGTGIRESLKNNAIFYSQERKECATEFMTLADYVIPLPLKQGLNCR